MEKCRHNHLIVRHYIVYNCNFSNLEDSKIAQREVTPIGCDSTNGIDTKNGRRPLYLNEEKILENDNFVYECVKDNKTGSVAFRAKNCLVGDQRITAGHYVKLSGVLWLCYRDLDGILHLRIRNPIHPICDSNLTEDQRCQQGIGQTILNSIYGYGEPFAYNPFTQQALLKVVPSPKGPLGLNLADGVTNLTSTDLMLAIRGFLDPSIASTTIRPSNFIPSSVKSKTEGLPK